MPQKKRSSLVYWHANCAQHHVSLLQTRSAAQASSQESSECTQDTSDAPTERPQECRALDTSSRRRSTPHPVGIAYAVPQDQGVTMWVGGQGDV